MGNATNSSQGKGTGTTTGTGIPAWSQVGSSAYNNMNTGLQTAPMAAANQTLAQGGQGATTQNAIGQLMSGAPGQIGTGNFADTAAGNYLGGSPYLDDIISKGAGDIATQTNQMFSAGGRYGSGAHQGTVADSIANYGNQLRNQNYQSERDRQLGAAGSIAGIEGQNIANKQSNLLGAAGLENQGFQNMLGMISQLPTIQNNKVFDANQQMGVGSRMDQTSQSQLNDLINQWTQGDMQDWARLGGLLTTGTGAAGNWGTQSGTQTTSQPPNFAGILGGIASLFSDARLKEDIKRVGTTDAGTPVYTYRYKGEPAYHMGVMAQEVADQPGVVGQHPSGFLMVDYSKVK